MIRLIISLAAGLVVVSSLGAFGYSSYRNQQLTKELQALTEPSAAARTECTELSVAAFRLMEARQHGLAAGLAGREYAYGRLGGWFLGGTEIDEKYQRYFNQLEGDVWSYSREVSEEDQQRVADIFKGQVWDRCLARYAPRMVHPPVVAAKVCAEDKKHMCDAIPAAVIGQDLCDDLRNLAKRTGHYINASTDRITVLEPSFERDRAAGNLTEVAISNDEFLKMATETTLAQLEAATGQLVYAAREICSFD